MLSHKCVDELMFAGLQRIMSVNVLLNFLSLSAKAQVKVIPRYVYSIEMRSAISAAHNASTRREQNLAY
jgi:hypothetical protein